MIIIVITVNIDIPIDDCLFLALAANSDGLRCYSCNSEFDSKCGEPLRSSANREECPLFIGDAGGMSDDASDLFEMLGDVKDKVADSPGNEGDGIEFVCVKAFEGSGRFATLAHYPVIESTSALTWPVWFYSHQNHRVYFKHFIGYITFLKMFSKWSKTYFN